MINEFLFQDLKEYLTKEYMRISDQKEEMTKKKIELQVEDDMKGSFLFEKKDMDSIIRLFSPLNEDVFESVKNENIDNENSLKIEEIENNVNILNSSMDSLKKYISFIQILEEKWKEKELEKSLSEESTNLVSEKTEELEVDDTIPEEEVFGISEDTKEMILTTIYFLETQYPDIEFLLDMIEEDVMISAEANANMIRVLTYTISSTIETFQLDTVKIDLNIRRNYVILTLQMICNEEIIGQFVHKHFLNRES